MFGVDWDGLLAKKYALLGQQANADTTRANAGMISANADANLSNIKAGLLPAESKATVANTNANTNLTTVNAGLAPGLAKASEAASYGQAKANTAQGLLYGSQTTAENQSSQTLSKALGGDSNALRAIQLLRSVFGGGGLPTSQ